MARYDWLTKIYSNTHLRLTIHDTLMIVLHTPFTVEMLQGVAQASHYHGFADGRWAHKPLVWKHGSGYDESDGVYANALYQIREIVTPDDTILKYDAKYLGLCELPKVSE